MLETFNCFYLSFCLTIKTKHNNVYQVINRYISSVNFNMKSSIISVTISKFFFILIKIDHKQLIPIYSEFFLNSQTKLTHSSKCKWKSFNTQLNDFVCILRYGSRNSTTAEEVSRFQCLFHNPNWLVWKGIVPPKTRSNAHKWITG